MQQFLVLTFVLALAWSADARAEGKRADDAASSTVLVRVDIEGESASMVTLTNRHQTLLDAKSWRCTARVSGTGAALVCVEGGSHETATNIDCARPEQRVATLFIHQRVGEKRVRVASFALLCQ